MPQLRAGRASIINTSSVAHRLFARLDIDDLDNRKNFSANRAYGDAKLANVLFTKSLHTKFHGEGLSSVAFHPGTVQTNFASDSNTLMRFVYRAPLKRLLLISSEKGGSTLSWFVEGTPDETWISGEYYDERVLTRRVNPRIEDAALAEALWQKSAELVGISAS